MPCASPGPEMTSCKKVVCLSVLAKNWEYPASLSSTQEPLALRDKFKLISQAFHSLQERDRESLVSQHRCQSCDYTGNAVDEGDVRESVLSILPLEEETGGSRCCDSHNGEVEVRSQPIFLKQKSPERLERQLSSSSTCCCYRRPNFSSQYSQWAAHSSL